MCKTWSQGQLIQREIRWISDPFLALRIWGGVINYHLLRDAIAVLVVGLFATILSKSKRVYVGFVWVFTLDLFCLKKRVKEEE